MQLEPESEEVMIADSLPYDGQMANIAGPMCWNYSEVIWR